MDTLGKKTRKLLTAILLSCCLTSTATAGWISTIAAMDAAEKAQRAANESARAAGQADNTAQRLRDLEKRLDKIQTTLDALLATQRSKAKK